jgi:predicted RNase H-like nuclease
MECLMPTVSKNHADRKDKTAQKYTDLDWRTIQSARAFALACFLRHRGPGWQRLDDQLRRDAQLSLGFDRDDLDAAIDALVAAHWATLWPWSGGVIVALRGAFRPWEGGAR